MTAVLDAFVEAARAVSVGSVMGAFGFSPKQGREEYTGPCPVCGGSDRFSINPRKNVWNCRSCGGGRDAISLAAHVGGLNVSERTGFLEACAQVLGEPVPDAALRESAEDRSAREQRLAKRRQAAEAARIRQEQAAQAHREKARASARRIYQHAQTGSDLAHACYLNQRLGFDLMPPPPFLRTSPAEPFFHGKDDLGYAREIHRGPAMVAPFIDRAGAIIGCHITWLDVDNSPKFRPALVDPNTGEPLASKKMRGSKKGGLIPLYGFHLDGDALRPDRSRFRLVLGEGIETVCAAALAEKLCPDTIYAAAGDLGNLAGPADPKSAFTHPTLRTTDKNGRERPLRVQGPEPLANAGPDAAAWAPPWVTSLVLITDSDSERIATVSAMARAKARLSVPGRVMSVVFPPPGQDLVDMLHWRATP